jgi:diguanylate cyclase (GGDEF)-like protein
MMFKGLMQVMKLWEGLSNYGNHLYPDALNKKVNTIINKVLILFTLSNCVTIIGVIALYLYLITLDHNRYDDYIYYYLPVPILQVALLIIFYYLKNITGNNPLFSTLAMLSGVVSTTTLCILLGQNTGYQFVIFIFLCAPFLFVGIIPRKHIVLVSGSLFAELIFVYVWFLLFPPLRPIPASLEMAMNFALLVFSAAAILSVSYFVGKGNIILEKNLEQERKKVEAMLLKDQLTGLQNRRGFFTHYDTYIKPLVMRNTDCCMSISDIDFFKEVNDTYGHNAGDAVLKNIATILTGMARVDDGVFRWGGEEFIILMPKTSLSQAESIGERLRQAIQDHVIMFEDTPISVTMSFGITQFSNGGSVDQIIASADGNLYTAKTTGRNRIVCGESQYMGAVSSHVRKTRRS